MTISKLKEYSLNDKWYTNFWKKPYSRKGENTAWDVNNTRKRKSGLGW